MSDRVFYLICLPILLLSGFGIVAWQDSGRVWQLDREISGGPIQSSQLPDWLLSPDLFVADSSADTSAGAEPIGQNQEFAFRTMTDSGVDFVYSNGPDDQFHLAETLGGGVAATDFDLDGDDDLIFVNGGNPVLWSESETRQVAVFRSQQSQFVDQISLAGINWKGYGHGCAAADINNDGFDDLLITGYQSSAVFINNGDGTFSRSDVLQQSTSDRWCATAAFCDLDADGDADLYITCYADTPRTLPTPVCTSGDLRIHCHPHFYKAQPDLLMENTGDGGFVDRSADSGIGDFAEFGLGVKIADFDQDGSMEIFVANDGDRNLLFRSTAPWTYMESAIASGLAFNGVGETMGSMGVACADFDRNGWFDLLTTNFALERNVLFSNLGGLAFVDDSQSSPLDVVSRPKVGWSAIALDANLDGWSDLFIANGHVTKMPTEDYAQEADFFAGGADGLQTIGLANDYFQHRWHARGAARTDLNGDHHDDLVISHIDAPASLLENQSPVHGNALILRLIGRESDRSANGAFVEVFVGGERRVFSYDRNAGYLSSNSNVLRIGTGSAEIVEKILISWPTGRQQTMLKTPTGTLLHVVEGRPALAN